jgi:hypothetical protein
MARARPTRPRLPNAAFALVALSMALLGTTGCVADTPDDGMRFDGSQTSALTEARRFRVVVEAESGRVVRGANAFDVRIARAEGAAQGGATLVAARAFMPAHGHGGPAPRIVAQDGRYRVENVTLYMPGFWELTMTVRDDFHEDVVTFGLDVP